MKIAIVVNFTAVIIVVFACGGILRSKKDKGKSAVGTRSPDFRDTTQGVNDDGGPVKKADAHPYLVVPEVPKNGKVDDDIPTHVGVSERGEPDSNLQHRPSTSQDIQNDNDAGNPEDVPKHLEQETSHLPKGSLETAHGHDHKTDSEHGDITTVPQNGEVAGPEPADDDKPTRVVVSQQGELDSNLQHQPSTDEGGDEQGQQIDNDAESPEHVPKKPEPKKNHRPKLTVVTTNLGQDHKADWKPTGRTILIAARGLSARLTRFKNILEKKQKLSQLWNLGEINGVSGSIQPAFPTIPVSNLHTMVTGLYPAKHGIVADEFYDPDLGLTINVEHDTRAYKSGIEQDVTYDLGKQIFLGEPIWESFKSQVACMYWPGCEFGDLGDYFVKFDPENVDPWEKRAKKVKEWLSADSPIKLVLMDYRDLIDVARKHESKSNALDDKLALFDEQIEALAKELGPHLVGVPGVKHPGRVAEILQKLNLNLIIVGTSGTAMLDKENFKPSLPVPDKSTKELFDVLAMQPTMWLVEPKKDQVEETLKYFKKHDKNEDVVIYAATESIKSYIGVRDATDILALPSVFPVPESWHYTDNKRMASLIITAHEEAKLSNRKRKNDEDEKSFDGYDNLHESMHPALIACGVDFKKGKKVSARSMGTVHVHLMLWKLLSGQPLPDTDSVQRFEKFVSKKKVVVVPADYIAGFLN